MIRTTIERTDLEGREAEVPAEVLAAIEPAHEYLLTRLKPAEHLPIQINWGQFDNRDFHGWTVNLRVDYDGRSASERLRVDQLRDPRQMHDVLRELVWKFADVLNEWVRSTLRRVREEMARDRAELLAESEA